MAAYAALVSLARLIDQILPQYQDYAFLCDKEQMVSLHQKTVLLQEFLEYNSNTYVSSKVDVIESRIRDAACQLEHIIESINCKSLGQAARKSACLLLLVISCICGNSGEAESHEQDSTEFLSCIAEIDIILEEATAKKFISAAHSSTTSSSRAAPTAEVVNVGLNNACTQMLDTITGQTSNLQIIPITGMGEYDIQEVLLGLLSSVKKTEQPDGRLIEHVHKYLTGRRFLIVLDDMWHGKAWVGVMNAFPDDKKGSRIILTTRQLGVALYIGSLSNVHKMQLLNEDQSWMMLREKVFGEEPGPAELYDLGRMISKSCKGLPLAIVVIAGLLKRNKKKDYWKEVARNTNAAAATDYDQLFGILSLSYTNLPPQLKACFLYVAAYPEDYEFQVKELVILWAAEGFLKPSESKTMEDIAEECITELVERSLFLVKKKTYNGKILTFSVHDVLREVSMKKAMEEKFRRRNSRSSLQSIINDPYKVSFLKNDLNFNSDTYCEHLRSFKYTMTLSGFYDSTPLRVLFKTTSLRYLYVVHTGRHITFPKSISKLQNLETFIARKQTLFCDGSTMPLDIWKLQRLKHIIMGRDCELHFPVGSKRGYPIMESLQTLVGVRNVKFSMDVIERIPNVKRMKLFYESIFVEKENCLQTFSFSNLQHLHQLEELSIWCQMPPIGILSDSVFPRNLKKLSLNNTNIQLLENFMSIVGSLPNLEVLKLKMGAIIGDIWEPVEGEFLQLKYLKMEGLKIEEWLVESFHFPCLQKLVINHCWYLKEVPECIGEIDTLEELVLNNCERAEESVQKIRENQQDFGNDSLKITIINL